MTLGLLVYICLNATPEQFSKTIAENPGQFLDCLVFRSFGELARSASHNQLYDYQTQMNWFAQHNPGATDASYVPYPPIFAVLWMLLSYAAPNTSYAIWSLSSVAVFLGGLLYLAKISGKGPAAGVWIFIGAMASIPSWRCVALGQTSLLYAGIFAFFCASYLRNQKALSAVAINLLAAKPPLAVLPALALCSKVEDRKTILWAIGIFAGSVIASVLILGAQCILSYPQALIQAALHPPPSFHVEDMVSLRGLLTSLRITSQSGLPSSIIFALVVAGFLYLSKRAKGAETIFVCLMPLATLAFGTHVHLYECTLLAIPALLLSSQSREEEKASSEWANKIFNFYPLLSWIAYILLYRKSDFFFSVFAVLNLLIFAIAVTALLRKNFAKPQTIDLPPS